MSTQLAKTGQTDIVREGAFDMTPRSLGEAIQLAELMAKSKLVPPQYQDRPGDILIAVQYGHEIGIKPLQALQGIAVINGRPTVWGDAALGVVLASGLMENYKEMSFEEIEAAGKAVFWAKRRGTAEPIVREFSVENAKKAGLWSKAGAWQQYPYRMLQMRARAWGLRDGFSDALKGMAIREEVEDITTDAPKVLAMPRRMSERPVEQHKAEEPQRVEQIPEPIPTPRAEPEIKIPTCESCNAVMEVRPAGTKNGHTWGPYYRCPLYTKGSQHSILKQEDWLSMQGASREPGADG